MKVCVVVECQPISEHSSFRRSLKQAHLGKDQPRKSTGKVLSSWVILDDPSIAMD